MHWIDPISLELLELTVERVPSLPVLLVVTFRPEFPSPWTRRRTRDDDWRSTVSAAATRQIGEHRLTGNKELPSAILDQITDHADGVPLFVEELTKTVLESGLLTEAGDRYVLSGPVPPLAIPTTLHASLMARLDRLAPIREVAQIGAAIGREFSYELLAALVPYPENTLQVAVERLVHSELVFCRGTPPSATYTFKHALIQDAAYATLLRSRRQELHARIAKCAGRPVSGDGGVASEILAHHCSQAGLVESRALCRKDLAARRRLPAAEGAPRRLGDWCDFVQAGQPISL